MREWSVFVLAVVAGCGSPPADGDGNPSSTASPTPTATVPADPRFEADIVPIFNRTCGALDSGCHARAAYGANAAEGCRGWLALEDASIGSQYYAGPDEGSPTGCPDAPLYERLTQIYTWSCGPPVEAGPNLLAVEPGNPSASYLWLKMSGGPYCFNTDPMPPVGTLPDVEKETLFRWIENGALRVGDP